MDFATANLVIISIPYFSSSALASSKAEHSKQ